MEGIRHMNVVYAMTRNVYRWIIPSIRSLAAHNPDAQVFILAEDDEMPFPLPISAKIINITGQEYFPEIAKHRTEAFGGYINHLKVCYPLILPVDKVIHIDIDTIICDKLTDLWDVDVSGKWFASVPESQTWYRPYGPVYFNMGVSLINLEQMRQDDAPAMLVKYLMSENRPYADQDAWNRYAASKGAWLPLRFNESRVTGQTKSPAIVHFCSIPDWWTNKTMNRREYLDKWRDQ